MPLPLCPDFGPAEAYPWGQAELRGSASSTGLRFFLPEPAWRWMHRARSPAHHGRVQENSKSLVPVGFMTQHCGCERNISQTGLEICCSRLAKGQLEAPEELWRGVGTVGQLGEVSAHKPPLTPHLFCATIVLSLGSQQMAEGRSGAEEISSPQVDVATAHR